MLINKNTGLQICTWVGKVLLSAPLMSGMREGDVCMNEKPLFPSQKT